MRSATATPRISARVIAHSCLVLMQRSALAACTAEQFALNPSFVTGPGRRGEELVEGFFVRHHDLHGRLVLQATA
jgi:hypothetical protein